MSNPTERFSTRVDNYVRYRPGYPPAVVALLREECGLNGSSVVADLGSGTGILAELFLREGCRVYGVEPNRDMRAAGERLLRDYPDFHSLDATAEETTLAGRSVDFITAGQSFHWFDRPRARTEFARILRPGGWLVIIWNERRTDTTPFLRAYEQLLHAYGTDYAQVMHQNVDESSLRPFFGAAGFRLKTFDNRQVFDFDGLRGRVLSSSYVPEPGDPRHAPLLRRLAAIFDAHQLNGRVSFDYETKVYYGHM